MTAKRAARSRSPRVTLTLGDFRATGAQDCKNTFDADDFDPEQYELADDALAAFIENMDPEEWISQQKDLGGLTGKAAFRAWLEGWSACALPRLTAEMISRKMRRLDAAALFYLELESDTPNAQIIESYDTLSDALDMLARVPYGTVYYGDGYGPNFEMVFTLPGSELLYWQSEDVNTTESYRLEMWSVMKAQALSSRDQAFEKFNRHYADVRSELRRRGYKWNPAARRAR